MNQTIFVLNGPNLNLLGEREPEIYGYETLKDVEALCKSIAEPNGFNISFHQTNAEHQMIEWIQSARHSAGIVINPAAFCYKSVPILDALKMCKCPIIEVHISNIHAREEEWRKDTIMAVAAKGIISGLGIKGYGLAVQYLIEK